MRNTRIYHPDSIKPGEKLTLSTTASHHLVRVLRFKAKAAVTVFNGKGGEYSALLLDNNPKAAQLQVLDYADVNRVSSVRITLLQGVSRNEHMDTTIQKTTELGITDIVPIICERSVRTKPNRLGKKLERWHQIVISACEQCGRNLLPEVHRAKSFDQAICDDSSACKFVLDPVATESIMAVGPCTDAVSILCGPEGGLSDREIDAACDAGFSRISFGPRILRTETAGPAIVAALQVIWGDMG